MKACENPDCAVRGRVIYTLATRCPLCKWDLGNGFRRVAVPTEPQAKLTSVAVRPVIGSGGTGSLLKARTSR